MGIYTTQRRYFEQAYVTGEHGWPVAGPSRAVVEFARRFSRERPGGRGIRWALDLGCGEGRHTYFLASRGIRTVGLDYQIGAVRRARALFPSAPLVRENASFVVGEAFAPPFREGIFDLVLDYGCLHHVRKSDFRRYLDALLSHLALDGYYLLSCFSIRFRHYPKEQRRRDWLVHRGHYDRFFKRRDFDRLFSDHFSILRAIEERDRKHPGYVFWHVLMQRHA